MVTSDAGTDGTSKISQNVLYFLWPAVYCLVVDGASPEPISPRQVASRFDKTVPVAWIFAEGKTAKEPGIRDRCVRA